MEVPLDYGFLVWFIIFGKISPIFDQPVYGFLALIDNKLYCIIIA